MNVFENTECPSSTKETLNYGYLGLNIYKDGKFIFVVFPSTFHKLPGVFTFYTLK